MAAERLDYHYTNERRRLHWLRLQDDQKISVLRIHAHPSIDEGPSQSP